MLDTLRITIPGEVREITFSSPPPEGCPIQIDYDYGSKYWKEATVITIRRGDAPWWPWLRFLWAMRWKPKLLFKERRHEHDDRARR